MTPDVPGLRELMRAGVRRSVAAEYRRLLEAGVRREVAVVLALGGSQVGNFSLMCNSQHRTAGRPRPGALTPGCPGPNPRATGGFLDSDRTA